MLCSRLKASTCDRGCSDDHVALAAKYAHARTAFASCAQVKAAGACRNYTASTMCPVTCQMGCGHPLTTAADGACSLGHAASQSHIEVEIKKRKSKKMIQMDDYLGDGQYGKNVENMRKICGDLLDKLNSGTPVCGQPYVAGGTYTLNCEAKEHPCGGPASPKKNTSSDMLAVLDVCVSPCMRDKSQKCCAVPAQIAPQFQCCREWCKCPDQPSKAGRAQTALGPRQVQVSVAVSVTVEHNTASTSVYDALLRCLQNPANIDAMCLTGSSGH